MEDFEKNRVEYVMYLEAQVKNLQRQLAEIQADEKWIPKFGSKLHSCDETADLTLAFGGNNQTARFSYPFLFAQSATDATTSILEGGFKDLIFDRLRTVVQPEVATLQAAVRSIDKAGKW